MTKDFFVTSIPATFLIDRKGRVVSIYSRGEQLEGQVKKLLAEKP
jgi:peroxiredoxin